MILDWFLIRNASVRLDFYAPFGVKECSDDHHGGRRADETEELAVDAARSLPVFYVSEIHAGTVDMFDGATCVFEGCSDERETLVGLLGDIGPVCPNGSGARYVNVIADADGAGEPDDWLEGRCAGDVSAMGHGGWMLRPENRVWDD
jgi:hypothetical protein